MKEKTWEIGYSIKYKDGTVREVSIYPSEGGLEPTRIKARTIWGALRKAEYNIAAPLRKDPEVSEVVIWDIGIVEDDVFQA